MLLYFWFSCWDMTLDLQFRTIQEEVTRMRAGSANQRPWQAQAGPMRGPERSWRDSRSVTSQVTLNQCQQQLRSEFDPLQRCSHHLFYHSPHLMIWMTTKVRGDVASLALSKYHQGIIKTCGCRRWEGRESARLPVMQHSDWMQGDNIINANHVWIS